MTRQRAEAGAAGRRENRLGRREWLVAVGGAALVPPFQPLLLGETQVGKRPRVAVLITEFTHRSHAHVLMENFLEPYYFNGQMTDPGVDVVSMYVDQTPADRDMSRRVSADYNVPIYPTISEALCRGGQQLDVDAVLSIGEHGNYPTDERGQRMYPRKRFFDEVVAVFRRSGRVVPVFNDKHLSYRWDWAQEMMQTARELDIPFMAGSSVPLAQRRPPVDVPMNAEISEAVSIHGGPLESYDFHAMEVLQSFVERRRGGESGVRAIQLLEGDDVWAAARDGRWSYALAEAAMRAELGDDVGPLEEFKEPRTGSIHPVHAILIEYRDGLRATILRVGHTSIRWNFACRLANPDRQLATSFYVGPWDNRNLFKALSHAIQTHFRQRAAPYPVERTYLVTGMLSAAMDSRFHQHAIQETPQLEICYDAKEFSALREMGDSWKHITEDDPEPMGITRGGHR